MKQLNRILSIIICLIFLLSTGNIQSKEKSSKEFKVLYKQAKKFKRKKNYYKAITVGAQAAKLESTNKSIVKFMVKYYKRAQKSEKKEIKNITKKGGEFYNDKLFVLYGELVEMYASLSKMPQLYDKKKREVKFEIKDFSKELEESKKAAAEAHYLKGKKLIVNSDIKLVKEACVHFKLCDKFIKGYKNYKEQIAKESMITCTKLMKSGLRLDKYKAALILKETADFCDKTENNKRYKLSKKLKKESAVKIYIPELKSVRDWDIENQIYIDGEKSFSWKKFSRDFKSSRSKLIKEGYNSAGYIEVSIKNYINSPEKVIKTENREAMIVYETNAKKKEKTFAVKEKGSMSEMVYNKVKKKYSEDIVLKKRYSIVTSQVKTLETVSSCGYEAKLVLYDTKSGKVLKTIKKSGNKRNSFLRKAVVGDKRIVQNEDKKLVNRQKQAPVSKSKLSKDISYDSSKSLIIDLKKEILNIYK